VIATHPSPSLRITLRDQSQVAVESARIEGDSLVGVTTYRSSGAIKAVIAVPLAGIVAVRRRTFSGTKSGLLVGGSLLVAIPMAIELRRIRIGPTSSESVGAR
jgi:hypothetical protein